MTIPVAPEPTGLEPTQTRRPWRATIRTIFAVGIPAILLLPTVFEIIVDGMGANLPPSVSSWLLAAGAFVTVLAGVITRIMALPQVELLLRMLPGGFLAAQPKPKPDTGNDNDNGQASSSGVILVAVALVVVIVIVIWFLRTMGAAS